MRLLVRIINMVHMSASTNHLQNTLLIGRFVGTVDRVNQTQ